MADNVTPTLRLVTGTRESASNHSETVVIRGVKEPSRSFTVPGKAPDLGLLLVESTYYLALSHLRYYAK